MIPVGIFGKNSAKEGLMFLHVTDDVTFSDQTFDGFMSKLIGRSKSVNTK